MDLAAGPNASIITAGRLALVKNTVQLGGFLSQKASVIGYVPYKSFAVCCIAVLSGT